MTEFYWQHIDPLWAGAATLLMLLGIALIYRSWRWQKRAGLVPGWLFLLVSLPGWSIAGTVWIGLPTGFSLLMLIALGWILIQGQWPTQSANSPLSPQHSASPGASNMSAETIAAFPSVSRAAQKRGALRLLLAGPLAAGFSLSVALLLGQLLTDTDAGRVLVQELTLSLLWPLCMAWVCLVRALRKPALIMAGSAIVAITMLSLI